MPTDKAGKFHMSAQRAMASDKSAAMPKPKAHAQAAAMPIEHMEGEGGNPHQPIHEGLRNAQAEHGGKHMHIHHDGMGGVQSHQVAEDGEPQGPHDHENLDALKQHMDQFFTEEGQEGGY